MTGYESKKAAARDKLLDNDDTQVYQSGFYDGKKAAAQEPTKYSFRAQWEEDGCIGVVAAIERLDGGVHLLKDIIDAPQRPWVGLTVQEIEAIGKPYEEKDRSMQAWGLFACAIEAKLKEKNFD